MYVGGPAARNARDSAHALQTARRERERYWSERVAGQRSARRFVVDWGRVRNRSVSHHRNGRRPTTGDVGETDAGE